MEEWLVVDGYNVIGNWPHLQKLKEHNLAEARDVLIETLCEYAVMTGQQVVIVFDAHQVPGKGQRYRFKNCKVIFTDKEETADDRIERLTGELRAPHRRRIFVATSDYAEQRITFGRGALRISSRELQTLVRETRTALSKQVAKMKSKRSTLWQGLDDQVRTKLEHWRRRK